MRFYKSILNILLLIMLPLGAIAQTTTVTGVVLDSITHEPMPYSSVFFRGTTSGVLTDGDGKFYISSKAPVNTLIISSVGYQNSTFEVERGELHTVTANMQRLDYEISEVVVTPKREKYKRKGNPAVDFANKVIEKSKEYNIANSDYYQHDKYDRLTMALNDFHKEKIEKPIFRRFEFLVEYVDTSEISGKPILPLSVKERKSTIYYSKEPKPRKKQYIIGLNRSGLDDAWGQGNVQSLYDEMFKEISIFDNDIDLLLTRFVSPLARIATSYYKFYLLDTVVVAGDSCVDLGFAPFNSESNGFVGHLYVTLDSTYFIKQANFNVPKDINLNYVRNLVISQTFERGENGFAMKTVDDMMIEMEVIPNTQGIYFKRVIGCDNFVFTPPDDMSIFDVDGDVIEDEYAELKPKDFWEENRTIPIMKKESAMEQILARLRENKFFFWSEKIISSLFMGYIPTSPDSKFDIGPLNTTISGNTVEGARLRLGGMTTPALWDQFFLDGYVAYGTRDGKFKYKLDAIYSLLKKKYTYKAFPMHQIRIGHQYDINQLGQHYLYTNKDNVFLALKRMEDVRSTYLRSSQFEYLREHKFGLSYSAMFNYQTETATEWVQFITGHGVNIPEYSLAETSFKVRYAHKENIYQSKSKRYKLSKSSPEIIVNHAMGYDGFLKSDFNYQRTDIYFCKEFWFSAFGSIATELKLSKVWTETPYTKLIIPNSNLSYTIQQGSYSLLNPIEFIFDNLASWDLEYFGNGILFNRIPYVQKLKMREVVSCKGFFGSLSDKNNPNLNPHVWQFPSVNQNSLWRVNTPYVEVGVGLDNILSILRIEYVFRCTYRDLPSISKGGVRFAVHASF